MAKQFDAAPGADKLAIVKSTVGGLGGTTGVRGVIDDTLITSLMAAELAIEAIRQRVIEETWPIA